MKLCFSIDCLCPNDKDNIGNDIRDSVCSVDHMTQSFGKTAGVRLKVLEVLENKISTWIENSSS